MTRTLGELAKIVRSKNAGPFELTFDVMFDDPATYERVKQLGVLTAERIAEIYRVDADRVLSAGFFDAALSFKATIARAVGSGTVGDSDVFGAQQHVPLMEMSVPWSD